jgi:hypothetical protein
VREAVRIVVLAWAIAIAPVAVRAQDAIASDGAAVAPPPPTEPAPSEPEVIPAETPASEVSELASPEEAVAEPEAEATPDPYASLVPGVADMRLADVDDGIDDLFAAWASERVFSGPTPVGSSLMLHTQLGARFGITRDARARIDWGFAYSSSHVVGDFADTTTSTMHYDTHVDRVEAQNPALTFEWAPMIDSTRFSFGVGATAPTAAGENIPMNVDTAAAYDASSVTHELMLAANGGLTPWRFRRERMGVFIPLSFLFPLERITIAIDGAAAISAPVIGAGRGVPVTGDLTADVQITGDLLPELRLGARFAIALLDIGASTAPGTIVQPSATGYVRLRIDPVFLVASILADVGGRYGLGSGGGVWSVTLGGGAAIP